MGKATELIEFKTGRKIEINSAKELIEILKYCNPMMIRHYQNQLKNTIIHSFGEEIKLKRVVYNEK
jgi:hypothetical protein